jgi:hypothetical protein
MSRIKSQQIRDFNSEVTWTGERSNLEIPNTKDIKDQFISKSELVEEEFSENINSSAGTWELTLVENVYDGDPDLVSIHVNGVKTNGVISVLNGLNPGQPNGGATLTISAYGYDIDTDDKVVVNYAKTY